MFERAIQFQNMLVDVATGGTLDEALYLELRKELMDDPKLKNLVPDFIRKRRSIGALWSYFKSLFPHWQPRREHIWTAFSPLLDYLEQSKRAPADTDISSVLMSFDQEGMDTDQSAFSSSRGVW